MKVTDVRLRKIQTDGRMKALVSITLDEAFVIHDLRNRRKLRSIRRNAKQTYTRW